MNNKNKKSQNERTEKANLNYNMSYSVLFASCIPFCPQCCTAFLQLTPGKEGDHAVSPAKKGDPNIKPKSPKNSTAHFFLFLKLFLMYIIFDHNTVPVNVTLHQLKLN